MAVHENRMHNIWRYWMDRSLPSGRIHRLKQAGIGAEELFSADRNFLEKLGMLTTEQIDRVLDPAGRAAAEKAWVSMQEKGITFLTLDDDSYPARLRQIIDPPYALYVRGNLPDPEKRAVAIVGARGRSDYGSSVARKLAGELAGRGIPVISGLAIGIDADAHMGCLERGGSTFGVLGCGPDVVYPGQNRFLYERLLEKGGLITEFPPGTCPAAANFPRRNRIISALSDVVCVVEARLHSGSLITADYALEQGKDVYALPGRITDPLSQGTNRLISQGAVPLISVEEFMDQFDSGKSENYEQLDLKQIYMSPVWQEVYALLDFTPRSLSELMDLLPCSLSELLDILAGLKTEGFVRETHPNFFVRCL